MTEQAATAPQADGAGYVLTIREREGPDGGRGRTLKVGNVGFVPLGLDELATTKAGIPLTIPIRVDKGTILETDIEGLGCGQPVSLATTLDSPMSCAAVSLVPGGWLPPSLAVNTDDATLLLDRNLVALLVGRSRLSGGANARDFLDLIGDYPVRINPLLYAMEGEQRQRPSPDQVASLLTEAVARLRAAVPKARVSDGPAVLQGALGLLRDSRAHLAAQQRFLVQVAPVLSAPVGRKRLRAVWDMVLAAATDCGLRYNSLAVLATLSAAAVPGRRSPARTLLKFRQGYSEKDAYNPLADLRALEILAALFALFPQENIQLCTEDRALARFWLGIRASNFRRDGNEFTFDLAPTEDLLPGETGQWWAANLPDRG